MTEVTTDVAIRLVHAAADRCGTAATELSRLDALAGDGDHGLNVSRAFLAADTQIAANRPGTPADVFAVVARSFSNQAGGASGALFGGLFGAVADVLRDAPEPRGRDLVEALRAGTERVATVGRSKRGDRTMLDALEPAIDAATQAVEAGGSLAEAMAAAADAAERGAAATASMRATVGRARYVPDGGMGSRDPGAETIAILFHAWAAALTTAHPLTRGERLDRLATRGGQFAILALDHARSFAVTMRPDDPDSFTEDETHDTKVRLIRGLADFASALLIDPRMAEHELSNGRAASGPGVIVGIEDGDYEDAAVSPRLLPGWSVERAALLGADAVKISFEFDPYGDTTGVERFVRESVRASEQAGLPIFCEPLAVVPNGSDRRTAVLEGIRRFGGFGADVLKVQFPGEASDHDPERWADDCAAVDAATTVPWALLSEGRSFGEFRTLLAIACEAGASGFLAGRAIWGGATDDRDGIAAAARRLDDLRSIASAAGRSWRDHSTRDSEGEGASHD